MNRNKNNMDLEQLLSDVERAGRDARRRDELAAMIDGLAGMPSDKPTATRHGFWWWSSRVAAAACVLFFISTAIRIWFIPTESHEPLVADVVTPPYPPQGGTAGTDRIPQGGTAGTDRIPQGGTAGTDRIPQGGAAGAPSRQQQMMELKHPPLRGAGGCKIHSRRISQAVADAVAVIPETLPTENIVAEEISDTLQPAQDIIEPSAIESIVAPVVSVAYIEPIAVAQADTPLPPSRGDVEQPRRSILASLFRQPEPDDMTGTVLAFRIL